MFAVALLLLLPLAGSTGEDVFVKSQTARTLRLKQDGTVEPAEITETLHLYNEVKSIHDAATFVGSFPGEPVAAVEKKDEEKVEEDLVKAEEEEEVHLESSPPPHDHHVDVESTLFDVAENSESSSNSNTNSESNSDSNSNVTTPASDSLDELLAHMNETSSLEYEKTLLMNLANEIISNVTYNSDNSSVLIALTKSHVYEITTPLKDDLVKQRVLETKSKNERISSMTNKQSLVLEEIKEEIESIEEAEKFAEHLTQQAIENLNSLIASSEERREESIRNMWTSLSKTMNSSVAMFVEARTSANKLRMEKLIETQSSNEKLKEELKTLLDKESWIKAGFDLSLNNPVPKQTGLKAIRALPLTTYSLMEDSKANVVNYNNLFESRRTRRHVGVIDPEAVKVIPEADDAGSIDPSTIFAYNLNAISALADEIENLNAKLVALAQEQKKQGKVKQRLEKLNKILNVTSTTTTTNNNNNTNNDMKWKSSAQLASEVAALEAEASVSQMVLLSQKTKSTSKIAILRTKDDMKDFLLDESDMADIRKIEATNRIEQKRDHDLIDAEASLDIALDSAITRGKIISMKNDARRELVRLSEAIVGEVERARDEVMAEAELERETEGAAIIRIAVIGEEATKAILEIIKVTFLNFANLIEHTFRTRDGQKQFILFVGACALTVFCLTVIEK